MEDFLLLIRRTAETSYDQILFRAIRNKIESKPNEAIIEAEVSLNWDEIKDTLITYCSDKRDTPTLIHELNNLVQGGSSLPYYKRSTKSH